jgi:hypothetical protein
MDACEPRTRHRGFFLHSETTGETDTAEHENPEGFVVRVRVTASHASKQPTPRVLSSSRLSGGRSQSQASLDEGMPAIRSESVTGSRQRAHLSR